VRRRNFLKVLGATSVAAWLPSIRRVESPWHIAAAAEAKAFSAAEVLKQARALAAEKFVRPKNDLPKALQELSYDQYRDIRVKPERAIWSSEGLPFSVDLLHRGFLFTEPVAIYIIARDKRDAWYTHPSSLPLVRASHRRQRVVSLTSLDFGCGRHSTSPIPTTNSRSSRGQVTIVPQPRGKSTGFQPEGWP
jgi:glucan biosynthesis protein